MQIRNDISFDVPDARRVLTKSLSAGAKPEVMKLIDGDIRFLCRHIVDVGERSVDDSPNSPILYGTAERRVR